MKVSSRSKNGQNDGKVQRISVSLPDSVFRELDQLVEVVALVPCDASGQRPWESALLEFELPIGVDDQLWLENTRRPPAAAEAPEERGGRLFAA